MKRLLAGVMTVLLLSTGCSLNVGDQEIKLTTGLSSDELFKIGGQPCNVSEAMVLITAQKKTVEDAYGEQIWEVDAGEQTFEEYVKDSLKNFLAKVKCMEMMAEDSGVVLSTEEETIIKNLAESYYAELTQEEKQQTGITEESALQMYRKYYLYNHLEDMMTQDMNIEVSDNEARIMQVELMFLSTKAMDADKEALKKKAEKFLKEVRKEESDFAQLADSYSDLEEIRQTISRDSYSEDVTKEMFDLSEGELSDVIEAKEGFYVVKCLNDYDREATAKHKEEMVQSIKDEAFDEKYEAYTEGLTAEFNEKVWEQIDISEMDGVSADFFQIWRTIEQD